MEAEQIRDDGSDNRPVCYVEGDRVIYRASAVGGPSHVLAAARAGMQPLGHTDKTKRYMAEGVLHEPAIMSRLGDEGWLLHAIGSDQAELDIEVTARIHVRCHPDGLATAREDMPHVKRGMRCVVEAKAMSAAVFDTFNRRGFADFYRYATQLSLQMHGTGLPGLFAIKNRNDGELRWQVFESPPVPFAEIRQRLMLIDKGAREGNLNPLNEKCNMFPCVFHHLHDEEPAEFVRDEMIDSLAEMVDRARERRTQAEKIERDAREKLANYLGEEKKTQTGQWRVSLSSVSRPRYDTKKMLEDGLDLGPYTTMTTYPQLRVQRIGLVEE